MVVGEEYMKAQMKKATSQKLLEEVEKRADIRLHDHHVTGEQREVLEELIAALKKTALVVTIY